MKLTECTVSGNAATTGGGMLNSGAVALTDCTFNGNSAFEGGGIYNTGTVTVTSSTFSGNSAEGTYMGMRSPGNGGGIAVFGTGNPEVTSINSIFDNSPGGNIYIDATSNGNFQSLGHNLFSDAPGAGLDPTDLINTIPLLGPLAAYGGATSTMALLPGSPAIDAGVAVSGVTTDQRGIALPLDRAPDIGAFESRGFTLAIVGGDGQSGPIGSAFAGSLVVAVASPFGEPVAGGRVNFAAPATGATAVLSTDPAIIDANGQAAVTATGSGSVGAYTVTAETAGAMDVAFTLTNLASPAVTGVARVMHSKHGITQIVLGFSADLVPGSATNRSFFSITSGVPRRHKLVFSKRVKFDKVSYDDSTNQVTIKLAKPIKRRVQVTVYGGIMTTDGLSIHGDFTAVLK
jgi:hypothetical protein